MIPIFTAEPLKLRRRSVIVAAGLSALAFATVAVVVVFLSAGDATAPGQRPSGGITITSLSAAGGATQAFSTAASFTGILVFVLFIANVAGEFSQGTFRTLLVREPRRVWLLAGKMAALLSMAAAVLLLTATLSVAASAAIAPSRGVSTASWLTVDGLHAALGDLGTAFLMTTAWALLGMALAVFVRSIPVALAIASSGPAPSSTSSKPPGALPATGSPDSFSRPSPPAARPNCVEPPIPSRSCLDPSGPGACGLQQRRIQEPRDVAP
jgi:ABC-2 type transport system permease protein